MRTTSRHIGLLCLFLAAALVGCGGGGSSQGTTTAAGSSSSAGGGSTGAQSVSAAQWQSALAAIGANYTPASPTVDPAGLATWNALLARGWPSASALIVDLVQQRLGPALSGLAGGSARVQSVTSITVDASAPPALSPGGTPSSVTVSLPAAPGSWSVTAVLVVTYTYSTTVAGIPISAQIPGDLTVRAQDVRIAFTGELDLSNPRKPRALGLGSPTVTMQLSLTSTTPIIQQVAGALTSVVTPIVKGALLAATLLAPQQAAATIASINAPTWGTGGPAAAAVSPSADLRVVADAISDQIQAAHLPFGGVVSTTFDQPTYGSGVPVGYGGYGDSAIWTGSYLAGEALRFDATGDARALAGATRALDYLTACLDAADPQGGLLGRCSVPLGSPFIVDISSSPDFYTGVHNGVAIGTLGGISRDQYDGTMLGLSQTVLRVPALRDPARALIGRIVSYADSVKWVIPDHNTGLPSAPCVQSPDIVFAFLSAANVSDRARFGPLRDANVDLASVSWLGAWLSARDAFSDYYKYNLGTEIDLMTASCESDPKLYRDHLKSVEVTRDVLAEHQNAWFDAVYAIVVPTAAPGLSSQIENEMQRWCLRSRRDHTTQNNLDPTIQQAPNPASGAGQAATVAVLPIPIEKRNCTDFLWQRGPFDLDGGGDPHDEEPGVDGLLPYWAARSFGVAR